MAELNESLDKRSEEKIREISPPADAFCFTLIVTVPETEPVIVTVPPLIPLLVFVVAEIVKVLLPELPLVESRVIQVADLDAVQD